MLDSLGSTLTDETLASYWHQFSLDPSTDQLTLSQLCQCLEAEVNRPSAAKKIVRPSPPPSGSESSDEIPSLDLMDKRNRINPKVQLSEAGPSARPPAENEDQTDGAIDPEKVQFEGNDGQTGNQVPVVGEDGPVGEEDDILDEEDDDDLEEDEAKERVINVKVRSRMAFSLRFTLISIANHRDFWLFLVADLSLVPSRCQAKKRSRHHHPYRCLLVE